MKSHLWILILFIIGLSVLAGTTGAGSAAQPTGQLPAVSEPVALDRPGNLVMMDESGPFTFTTSTSAAPDRITTFSDVWPQTPAVAPQTIMMQQAMAIAAGYSHTCALTTGGGVKCWGWNVSGQLGDGTTTNRLTPVDVSGLASGVAAIAAGNRHTCALTTGGGVKCWGWNEYGQLGDGTTIRRLTPVDVSGLASGVAAIATGSLHTCALTTGGGVKCWGRNEYGQLGDGTTTDRLTPVDVSGLASGVAAIAAGWSHTCAVTTSGGVKCWGRNEYGQLGDTTTTDRLTPVDVSGLTIGVAAIAAGSSHTCALTTVGGIKCWGNNWAGQLGDGTMTRRLTPVNVSGLTNGVAAIAAGWSHTCAVKSSDGVKCWGYNQYGQLGDGTTIRRLTPVDVSGLASGMAAVVVGTNHTCATTSGGGVKCWGNNSYGQLGDGTEAKRLTPVDINGLASGVAAIATGSLHTCALTTGGGVKCWGDNGIGQLGDGTWNSRYTPVDVSGLAGGVAAIAAGANSHTCALTTSGGVKCWGNNTFGPLGDGTTTHRQTPVNVSGLASGVAAIAAGFSYTCAVTTGGGVKCWGYNQYGQLGDGTTANRLTPVDVSGLASGVMAIAAGGFHTCALTTGGGVKCWGWNVFGQLGDGTTTDRLTPVDVSGLTSGVAAIAAGSLHTCALTTGGAVKCWGENSFGQLGDGTTTDRLTPGDVSGLTSNVAAIVAGREHSCALTTGGGIKCWGDNVRGQLGDGTTIRRLTPVDVSGLASGVATIAAGSFHTCAVTTGGGVKCWGANDYGQLAIDPGWTPVDVVGFGAGNCSQANSSLQPLLFVAGWSGSRLSAAEDDQLKFFFGDNGHLAPYGYVEGCNLFYAKATSPYLWLADNGQVIRANLCLAHTQVKAFNPAWNGRFDIVAFSYGGLRARAYLENSDLYGKSCPGTQIRVYVDNLFTMGTPHGGEPYPDFKNILPIAGIIGLCAVANVPLFCEEGGGQWPALAEMEPATRMVQNLRSSQPTGVCYRLLSGDARPQVGQFPWKLIALTAFFPSTYLTANDLAVHRNSANILSSLSHSWRYPRTVPINTPDLHGHAPEDEIGQHTLRSYVNPNTTFVQEIWPILRERRNCLPVSQTVQVSDADLAITELLAQQSEPQTTIGIPMIDIAAGGLTDDETTSGSFTLSGAGSSQIMLSWLKDDLVLSLVDPDGTLINPTTAQANPNVDYLSLDTGFGLMSTYLFTNTVNGVWQYTITGTQVVPATAYRLIVLPPTPIAVSPSLPQWLPNNTPVVITATVAYSQTTPVIGGMVKAQINRPDGTLETISLYDDGAHQDGQANDGVFGGVYTQTVTGGIYGLLVTATGIHDSEIYTRTATAYFTVAPAGAALGEAYSDSGIDDTGNGIYDWLEVTAQIDITEATTYTLSAELYAGETFIAHTRQQAYLATGSQSLAVLFSGPAIFERGLDGPYIMRNVMLLEEAPLTLLIEAADNAYVTQAYRYTDFGQYMLYLAAILH